MKRTCTHRIRTLAGAAALMLAATSLAGCAGGPGGFGTPSQLSAVAGDACTAERVAFGRSQTYFQDRIVAGAVTGGAIGAGTGALIGGLAGGWRGAGIGALAGLATGAVAGGVSSYYSTMAERYQDQETLAQAINADLSRESQEMDHVLATFARLRECRFAQARGVRQAVRAGSMTRPQARDLLIFQRDRFQEELALADQYRVSMGKRDQEFQAAAAALNKDQPVAASTAPRARAQAAAPASASRQVAIAATETVPEKRSAFANAVAAARRDGGATFDLDAAAAS
jgi:outer membrane lipoprotein SlyB